LTLASIDIHLQQVEIIVADDPFPDLISSPARPASS
jgi:hypothetical protein